MTDNYESTDRFGLANRRQILRALGVGGIASVSSIGPVSASTTESRSVALEETVERYETKGEIRTAIESHAKDFIKALCDTKYIDRRQIIKEGESQLSLGKKVSGAEFNLEAECVRVTGMFLEGRATARILSNYPIGDKVLQINVLPEIDKKQALLRPLNEDSEDAWIQFRYTKDELHTNEFSPNAADDDDISTMVETYSDCLLSYEEGRGGGRYYCNEVTVQCWGSTTPEGCEIVLLSGECDGIDCPIDHENLCMDYCSYT